jgi:hypothetical protein
MRMILGSSRDHYLVRVGIFLIMLALIVGVVGCDDGGGDDYPPCLTPPPSQNLEIRTWYDLYAVGDNLTGNHTLMNDLDSTTAGYEELASPRANQGKGWEPIGTFIPQCGYGSFLGTFDGQGHEICDLYINRPDEGYVGLFGVVNGEWDGGGVIKDIGVVNVTVIGDYSVGGLVGRNIRGTISNCHAIGNISGDSPVGGLVGYNQGPLSNCYATGNVVAGGVVGHVGAVVGGFGIGGLVGLSEEGTIDNCYFTGTVTSYLSCVEEWDFLAGVGSLVGVNYGTVSNSYSNAKVTGKHGVGGLVGRNLFYGTISNSYFTGSVTGNLPIGGLIADNIGGTVSNSYYNYDKVLINEESIITIGALFGEDFEEWLAYDKFLDVNERLSQENGYYLINNVDDFKQLLPFGQDATLKFRLTNDLDLSDEPNFYIPYFAGEFDGNGHKISNLSLNSNLASPLGLFGHLASGGEVTQVGVENIDVTGYSGVGGLVGGTQEGTVSYCYSTGRVAGNDTVGGLVGNSNFGILSDSYSTANVKGYSVVGGLIGGNAGTVSGGTVSNSYSSSNVTGNDAVGGLVGVNEGTVSNSYSSSRVTGDEHVGGLVGANYLLGTVNNSYSTGSVTGDEYVGGLVGSNGDSGTVSNSYSIASVTGKSHVGGLVGRNYFGYGEGTVSNSFWDTETSGQATSDGGMGKTTAEMQDIATFSGAGWNIRAVNGPGERNLAGIWNIVDDETYPFLSWQP